MSWLLFSYTYDSFLIPFGDRKSSLLMTEMIIEYPVGDVPDSLLYFFNDLLFVLVQRDQLKRRLESQHHESNGNIGNSLVSLVSFP